MRGRGKQPLNTKSTRVVPPTGFVEVSRPGLGIPNVQGIPENLVKALDLIHVADSSVVASHL